MIPIKYAQICQEIQEELHAARANYIQIHLDWIPGHTDNPWNDRADVLAKLGAAQWLEAPPPACRALTGIQPRYFSFQ